MDFKDYVKQNNTWEEKAEKLYEIQKLRAHYNKLADSLLQDLIKLSSGQNSLCKNYVFRSYNRVGAIDYKRVPELKYVDLEKYRKDSITMWKLENVGIKFIEKTKD
jgi:hypothetical protein